MDPCMYLVMASPDTTPMSPGKLAAQAAHAAVEAYLVSDQNKQAVNRWRCGGHYKKIVLMTDDVTTSERYVNDRGFKTALIIDEGRTEFTVDLTPTGFGVEILDKDDLHVRETFGAFKLYADSPSFVVLEADKKVTPEVFDRVKKALNHGDVEEAKAVLHTQAVISRWGRGRPPWRK